jgi:predicted DNA-binding protein with PD1-like motif
MPLQNHVFRLKPGENHRKPIQQFAVDHHIKAGWMVTCAGSLTGYNLRFANQSTPHVASGHFEILVFPKRFQKMDLTCI